VCTILSEGCAVEKTTHSQSSRQLRLWAALAAVNLGQVLLIMSTAYEQVQAGVDDCAYQVLAVAP